MENVFRATDVSAEQPVAAPIGLAPSSGQSSTVQDSAPEELQNRVVHSGVLRVGVVGYGYWGPNVVRNFQSQEHSTVTMICDSRPEARHRILRQYPGVEVTAEASEITHSPNIDVVAIVTPVWTHFELAKDALLNGKHVFVEKPFTCTAWQAEELIELAGRKRLTIMVDHTFLFTGAVQKIKELIVAGELGTLYYYDSMRVNLGLFQHDVNVIWDLAPHDLAIMDYLLPGQPQGLVASGEKHVNHVEDIAFITIYYPNQLIAHINVNWLSPIKVRTTLVGGKKKLLMWNDLNVDEKLKIYDKGVEKSTREGVYDLLVSYRSGDMWAPRIDSNVEALKMEIQHMNHCVINGTTPINDGQAGLRIVKMLEAANESLNRRGGQINL